MALVTLGRLELVGHSFPQRQALLLLAYLTVEGRKERPFLAELFWPEAKQPLNNLSSALTRIRSVDNDFITSDRYTVEARIASDVDQFVAAAAAGHHDEALDLYHGRFLDGFPLNRLGYELQEWVLDQRAHLAGTARDCARRLAEQAAGRDQAGTAVALAERSLALGQDAVPDPATLRALYPILRAGSSPLADAVRLDATELGVDELDTDQPPSTDPGPATTATEPSGLRARVDRPFFNRVEELEQLTAALHDGRPVAAIGLGGIGKSELARALVERLDSTLGPSHWVDVSTVESVELLPEVLSPVLAPDESPATDLESLGALLGRRQLVVVLDGVDAMADDLGRLVDLLAACPGLRLILTSRAEVALGPCLQVSLHGLSTGRGPAPTGPAVELFRTWFERQAPLGAELDPDDPAPGEICRHLDGHPLAIELAAGWLNILTPREIADGLTGRSTEIELLYSTEGDPRAHPTGFQSVMDGTWSLLDEPSRLALARLSVVPGGFDRSVAESVGQCSLITLRRLASWSLVSRSGGRWYRIHPLVQTYGRQRLAESPVTEAEARTAHAQLVLGAVSTTPDVDSFEAGETLDTVEDPVANLLTAWEHLVEEHRFGDLAELVDPLDRVLGHHGRLLTLLEVLEGTAKRVAALDAGRQVRDRLDMHLVWLHLRLGDYRRAATMADRLLQDPDGIDDDIVVEATRARVAVDRTEGDVERALERLLAVRDRATAVSGRMGALVDDDIGLCQMVLGQYAASRESYGAVLAWARREGSQPIIARTLLSLGIGHLDDDEVIDALAYLLEAKAVVVVNGLTQIEPYVDVKLGRAHLADGDTEAATALVDGARRRAASTWEPWLAAEFDLLSARLASAGGDPASMWDLVEQALSTSVDLDDVPFIAKACLTLVDLGSGRPEVGPGARGERVLLQAVAGPRSAADAPDRRQASRLLAERHGEGLQEEENEEEAKRITEVIDTAYSYLRRGRLLTSRPGDSGGPAEDPQ